MFGVDADRALAGAAPPLAGLALGRTPRGIAAMKPRHKRLAVIGGIVVAVGVAAALVLNAFQSNLVFFYSPSQIAAKEAPQGRTFRIGGLVKEGSLKREGTEVQFLVTDTAQTVLVRYQGILPDLFKEGKGVVAQGQMRDDGVFVAREVLAKHDENYMPPEATEALKRAAQTNQKIANTVVGGDKR
jgi:cytochrome c-type biogenesis protein CcmE